MGTGRWAAAAQQRQSGESESWLTCAEVCARCSSSTVRRSSSLARRSVGVDSVVDRKRRTESSARRNQSIPRATLHRPVVVLSTSPPPHPLDPLEPCASLCACPVPRSTAICGGRWGWRSKGLCRDAESESDWRAQSPPAFCCYNANLQDFDPCCSRHYDLAACVPPLRLTNGSDPKGISHWVGSPAR